MNEQDQLRYDKVPKTLKKRFIPAIILITIIILFEQILIQGQLSKNENLSRVINVSGRQRMLSQMITKDVIALLTPAQVADPTYYLEELKSAVATWSQSHQDLTIGNDDDGGIQVQNSDEVKELFANIEPEYLTILKTSHEIISIAESKPWDSQLMLKKARVIQSSEDDYLLGMDNIVSQYDKEYSLNLKVIAYTKLLLFVLLMMLILFVTLCLFRPAIRFLINIFQELREANDNTMKLLQNSHGALILLEKNSLSVIMMNYEAEALFKNQGNNAVPISEVIKSSSLAEGNILERIRTGEKFSNFELTLKDSDDNKNVYLFTTIDGTYQRKEAVLISLFDITTQKRAEETLRKMAIKDELTGLYNRHYLDSIMEEELERSKRYNYPISLLILDLDYFKRINDTWGHPVGDLVLKHTAEITRKAIRRSDSLIRFGGEEFILLMPHTNIKEAIIVAEKIRQEIETHPHPVAGEFTASFGVSQRMVEESFQTLYEHADVALYRAKEEGRNRVVSYEDSFDVKCIPTKVEWKAEWFSGNAEIDQQHRHLIELANELIAISRSQGKEEEQLSKLEAMILHISHHFEYEENVLKMISYPEHKLHIKVHILLLEKIEQLKQSYVQHQISLSTIFTFIMDEVIVGHFFDADTHYFSYIKEQQSMKF